MTVNDILETAVADGDVPFVVAMAADRDGVIYSHATGEAAPGMEASEATAFRIFSMTKAVGSFAAMLLVDRGKLSLDTPVANILPDWDALQVLEGWEGDRPVLRAPKTTATIRHLMTHRSGLEYEFWNPDVPRYLEFTGNPSILSGTNASLMSYPLTFDPGARWGYGLSIDWLGKVVEAVDGRQIDKFCQAEIFDPLGMTDTAFEPDALTSRLAQVRARGEDGAFQPFDLAPPPQPEFYGMGHALYSTAPDYLRFCRMILRDGELNGTRLISETTLARLLEDQMEGKTFGKMVSIAPPVSADVELPDETGHSAGFVRFNADIPGMRHAGSQAWAGVCNTHYWIDPAANLCAVIMTQSLPFVEPRFMQTYQGYEQAIYASQPG